MKHHYQPIDSTVWLNVNDPSLFPIPVNVLDLIKRTYRQYGLEEPDDFPSHELVAGYGLPPDQQMFTREVTPIGLIELERSIRYELKPRNKTRDLSPVRRELAVIERFWQTLDEQQVKYTEEIEWLRLMWYYRLFGKHLFVNGKHTYIPGFYWFYLNYWHLNGGRLPDYWDRDRKWSIGLKYCETTTETFANIDEKSGMPIPEHDGTYRMIDIGRRTIFGPIFTKARRVGDTSKLEAYFCEMATRTNNCKIGIQGMTDSNASTVFSEHLVYPFTRLPVFLKPTWDSAGGIAPKSSLVLDDPEDIMFGLHSLIDYATSSEKSAYDGKFLNGYHIDEGGKMVRSNVNEVIDVVKFCLALGGGSQIHGVGASSSTCDEIEDKSAGENYMKLCERSHFERRDANGQTNSGFINIYFPATEGLKGFIGRYGESIIDDPTPEQAMFIGKTYGANKFIDNRIADYRRTKNWEALAMFRRQHPRTFMEAFTPPPKAQLLRRDLIEDRIQYLETSPEHQAVRGNFVWADGKDSHVLFIPDDEGRFYLSRKFLNNEQNLRISRDGSYAPLDTTRFVCSVDTFGLRKPAGRKSNGSIVVRWRRDKRIDPLEKNNDEVQSDRVICTYSFRPEAGVDAFNEDVLMCAVYIGAMVYPERNQSNTIEHLRRRGYEGYLLYDYDRNTGKRKSEPGWWNGAGNLIDETILVMAQDISNNISRHFHLDLLKESLEFGGRKYLTDCDLIAAYLGTLIAERNAYYNFVQGAEQTIDVTGWIPWYSD